MIDEREQRGCTRIHLRVAGLGLLKGRRCKERKIK